MNRILIAFCFLPVMAAAQNFHFSGRFGLAGYHGDLKERTVTLSQANIMASLGVQYDLSERFIARSYVTYTSLQADDKKGNADMRLRNLNFKSRVLEGEISAQYNILDLNYHWWTPYVYAGVGIYHFNPYTKDRNGDQYFLRPLSTEGEGFAPGVANYKITQFNVPLGIGALYALNEDMRLGIELGYRKLFTDYLDDVSNVYIDQSLLLSEKGAKAVELAYRGDEIHASPYPVAGVSRGNPGNKDGYYYVAVTYTVRYFFDKYKQIAGIASFKKDKRVGCPSTRN